MSDQTSITKKLVSVFLLNGKVLIKNLPADQGTIGKLKLQNLPKMASLPNLVIFAIYEPIKSKKK